MPRSNAASCTAANGEYGYWFGPQQTAAQCAQVAGCTMTRSDTYSLTMASAIKSVYGDCDVRVCGVERVELLERPLVGRRHLRLDSMHDRVFAVGVAVALALFVRRVFSAPRTEGTDRTSAPRAGPRWATSGRRARGRQGPVQSGRACPRRRAATRSTSSV